MRNFLMVVLFVFCGNAFCQELTLFDLPLENASRADLKAAIKKAGGRFVSSKGLVDIYDAKKIGLPVAQVITVLYAGEQFVLAKYSFSSSSEAEERLRRMLISKYGNPIGTRYGQPINRDFGGRFIDEGVYSWKFSAPMEVQYNKPFSSFDGATLSYVNTLAKKNLDIHMEKAEQERTNQQALKNKSAF